LPIDPSKVLIGIPSGLREPLVEEYRGICEAFLQGKWKATSLDAGRFCEVVYTILDGALAGFFASSPSKPSNFPHACRALESRTAISAGDHSIRLLIPRVIIGMYDVRNNRNVGHVGGDVIANHMDATLVHANAAWVLAELIRVFHGVSVQEAQQTVDMLVDRCIPLIWEIDGNKRVMDTTMSNPDKVLLLLYGEAGWVQSRVLCDWVKYSNLSVFRTKVLGPLDDNLLIELDSKKDQATLSPLGIQQVEKRILSRT
jgi:hypothetical protein